MTAKRRSDARSLGALTDDPVALANRAIKETEDAVRDNDPVGVRQGANKAWLAICSLADVAAAQMGMPIPGGCVSRREVLLALSQLGKIRHSSLTLAFEGARATFHGECFHEDKCPSNKQLINMMKGLRDEVRGGVDAIPVAERALRKKNRKR